VSRRKLIHTGLTLRVRVGLWNIVGKMRVGGKLSKSDFAQFVFTVELVRVCDCFDDFLDDAGW
jgi:hypothetical protein